MGSVIGELTVTDPDINDTHTFTLLPGLQSNQVRISEKLMMTLTMKYFHHSPLLQGYMIKVDLQTLTVSVINQNEAPHNFSFTPNAMYTCSVSKTDTACVPENSVPFQGIGQLYATNPDGDNVTYSLLTNLTVPASFFNLNQAYDISEIILSSDEFNYESRMFGNQIILFVEISDQFGHFSVHTVTVDVLNVNDPPSTITLSNRVVSELAPVGQIYGLLEAVDEDEGDQLTYRLDHSPSGVFKIEGNHLVVASSLNYENTVNIYNISITCSDGIAETEPTWFVIEIDDAYESPINILLDNTAIPENSPLYTEIGVVTAYDMNNDETLTFQLDDDARFANTTSPECPESMILRS